MLFHKKKILNPWARHEQKYYKTVSELAGSLKIRIRLHIKQNRIWGKEKVGVFKNPYTNNDSWGLIKMKMGQTLNDLLLPLS